MKIERLALARYAAGPALSLVDELALVRTDGELILAAKFCNVATGLGYVWRRYAGGSFNILRSWPNENHRL